MSLANVIEALRSVTPVTPEKFSGLPLEPAPSAEVTQVTQVTPDFECVETQESDDGVVLTANNPNGEIAKFNILGLPGYSETPSHNQLDPLLQTHEIVTFDRWRLPSGRYVSFKLAIPREKYDAFHLIRMLDEFEAK